jgi:hypothetical protein
VIWRFNVPHLDPEASLTEQAHGLRRRMREELGEDKARQIWALVGKRPRGRIPGKHVYDVSRALELFDSISKLSETDGWSREQLVRSVAEFAYEKYPGRYGATRDGIAQHLKRALREREKRDAELQAKLDTWRNGMGPSGPGSSRSTTPLGPLAAALLEVDKKSG